MIFNILWGLSPVFIMAGLDDDGIFNVVNQMIFTGPLIKNGLLKYYSVI